MSRIVHRECHDSQYIFNLIQCFPNRHMVIDVRDHTEFSSNHLARALNIPFDSEYSEAPDINEIRNNIEGDRHIFDVRKRLVIIIVYSPPSIVFSRELDYILRKDKCREIYVLEEEFAVFAEKYPFLCQSHVNLLSDVPK